LFLFVFLILTLIIMLIYSTFTFFNYKYKIDFQNDNKLISHVVINSIFKYLFIYFVNYLQINYVFAEYKNIKLMKILEDFRLYFLLCFFNIFTCIIYYVLKKLTYKE